MEKSIRLWIAEKVFNKFLKPYEKVVIAQKVLAAHGSDPKVRAEYEKAFGVNQTNRTQQQWKNLVRVYGLETVAKIEGLSTGQVELRCMKFSERLKKDFINKAKK